MEREFPIHEDGGPYCRAHFHISASSYTIARRKGFLYPYRWRVARNYVTINRYTFRLESHGDFRYVSLFVLSFPFSLSRLVGTKILTLQGARFFADLNSTEARCCGNGPATVKTRRPRSNRERSSRRIDRLCARARTPPSFKHISICHSLFELRVRA